MKKSRNASIPDDFVLFISGVPGVGKTTVSYELLKKYNDFRIIEETDLIREILRGYNDYLIEDHDDLYLNKSKLPVIADHTHLLSFQESKEQCRVMTKSFERIVSRQLLVFKITEKCLYTCDFSLYTSYLILPLQKCDIVCNLLLGVPQTDSLFRKL